MDKEEEKRHIALERNRVAGKKRLMLALKCRQKKKEWVTILENETMQASERNKDLRMQVNELRQEVLKLKNMLLAHKNCGCKVIHEYIRSSSQFALNNYRQSGAAAGNRTKMDYQ